MTNSSETLASMPPLAAPRASCGYGTAFDEWVELTEELAEQMRRLQLGNLSARAEVMRLAHALESMNHAEHLYMDSGAHGTT